jgi:hypothetical protein
MGIINNQPIKNITGAASSTGKYHPKCSNGEFGLCHHTKLVVQILMTLLKAFPCSNKKEENLVAAALLHDFCKYSSDDAEYVDNDHAHKMAKILRKNKLKDVARLVDSHMGRWNDGTKSPIPKKWDEKLLHMADMIASQHYINTVFDDDHNLVE